jgi:Flp pilus assembly protein TadG
MVEFAIIVVPFFVLLFGTLELGFILWGTYDLENATHDAARSIRTGQVQTQGVSAEQFRERICSRATLLPNCTSELRVDVRSFGSMDAMQQADPPAPLDDEGNLQDDHSWNAGGPSSIVLVSAFYPWPLFNLTTSYSMSNMANGDRLLRTSVAFRNEPWPEN